MIKYGAFRYLPLMMFQIVLLILYFEFVRYSGGKDKTNIKGFEDIHVMIFIGFGFLMTFLKKYCYSALGFNWLLGAIVIQWALLCQSFFHMEDKENSGYYKIYVTKMTILEADVMAATVLITFGALLGLASGLQLMFIAIVETAVGCANLWLVTDYFKASDVGGSIAIHAFGAYFGLGASMALRFNKSPTSGTDNQPSQENNLNGATYTSDITAMIGSIFLWIYWPSFNSGLVTSDAQYERAIVNTYLSLAAATVTTFFVSSAISKHGGGRLDMVHIQNSTLAGGVAVGSVCNMMIGPGGAIAVGIGAGVLSVAGYRFLTPLLEKIGIMDTCGVNNLHGMPGIYSGLLSVLFALKATTEDYRDELPEVFEAMHPGGRSPADQALYQFLALAATLGVALVSGFLTGLASKIKVFEPLDKNDRYNDELNWEVP